jgi:hypothetical protein
LKHAVRNDAPLQGLVLVMVRGDETGHHDRARAVDYFGVGSRDVRRDIDDQLPVDNTSAFEVSHRVELSTMLPQQDAAFAAIADEVLEVSRSRSAQAVELPVLAGSADATEVTLAMVARSPRWW